jgi:hypothetical protein
MELPNNVVRVPMAELLPRWPKGLLGKNAAADRQETDPQFSRQRALLQLLRVDIQALQTLLAGVRDGSQALNAGNRAWLAERSRNIDANLVELETITKQAESLGHSFLHSHSVLYLTDIWQQVKLSSYFTGQPAGANGLPDAAAPADQDQSQVHSLAWLDSQFRKMIFEIGYYSIPMTLDEWLRAARPGYYVPFHATFEDEIQSQEDRTKLLNLLASSPGLVSCGIVDAGRGLIYRYDPRRMVRWVSVALVVLLVLLATWLVAYAANPANDLQLLPQVTLPWFGGRTVSLGPLTFPGTNMFDTPNADPAKVVPAGDWPLTAGGITHESTLMLGWLAVLLGVAVHIAVSAAKGIQAQMAAPPVLAVSQLTPRINAFFGQIVLKILMALVAFFGIALTTNLNNESYVSFFLAGYTLDSVVDLFGSTLDKRAAAQANSLQQQLGAAAGAGTK